MDVMWEQKLKERWLTKDGKPVLVAVIKALQQNKKWESFLHGFPYAEEKHRDLRGAALQDICLQFADLQEAHLEGAYLQGSGLQGTNLEGAYLQNSYLQDAILQEATLQGAHLQGAHLQGSHLEEAYLQRADLKGAFLNSAHLEDSYLQGAELQGAHLEDANLRNADLRNADLRTAILKRTVINSADLRFSFLSKSILDESCITGVKLFGSSRDDWSIKGVRCDYVFWDKEGKDRTPVVRDFKPGEFERLYASLPTIEYVFKNVMTPLDPLIMDWVVKSIQDRLPELDIKIDSFNARGLAPSIKLTVRDEGQKEVALEQVRIEYETRLKLVEGERDRLYALIGQALATPKSVKQINGGIVVEGDAVFNIQVQQAIHHISELQQAVLNAPDETLSQTVKRKVFDTLGKTLEDVAKGQVKEVAKQVWELGKEIGPVIAQTAAYGFFKSLLGP